MKLFFHGRLLRKGEHMICQRCKVKRDFDNFAQRDVPVWFATLVQFSQGGKTLSTALIGVCDECHKTDKMNEYVEGWRGGPDCGGECCTGKVSRADRSFELRARAQEVRLATVGSPMWTGGTSLRDTGDGRRVVREQVFTEERA